MKRNASGNTGKHWRALVTDGARGLKSTPPTPSAPTTTPRRTPTTRSASKTSLEALQQAGEPAGQTPIFPARTVRGANIYVNPSLGYSISLPDGFVAQTDPGNPAIVAAAGTINCEMAAIVAVGLHMDTSLLGREGPRAAAQTFADGIGGTLVRIDETTIQGTRLFSGIYDVAGAMHLEVVMFPRPNMIVAIGYGTPPATSRARSARAAACSKTASGCPDGPPARPLPRPPRNREREIKEED